MEIQILARKFYEYSQYMRGYSPATIRRYRSVITYYCRFAEITLISEITNENLRALFLYGRTEKKWTTNTYIVYYKSLKVFLRWCQTEGYLSSDPLANIAKPKIEQTLPIKLNKQDTQHLLEVVYNYPYTYHFLRYRNHAMFSMFIFAGLRKGELLNLKFADVDIENQTIFIRQGKGSKDRIVPMSATLAQTLKRYVQERNRLKKTCPEFFVSLRANMGFTDDGMRHLVNTIRTASGMKFSVHKLRHTFATMMLEGGCDIYSLSKMMGHSDIKTTTIYLAASAEHLRLQMTKHPLNEV